ncbi:hypothetical protein BD289DRAFT_166738 [Coniella lustricola]|uniref:Uncharacterized protein n=1 Tax=Coniella lustricola TaxID=2025994 RepID=A0A2T3AE54_9PEZI|nr:hypothetical protein BD289DRAFT_166738 [Coniella lustricola]
MAWRFAVVGFFGGGVSFQQIYTNPVGCLSELLVKKVLTLTVDWWGWEFVCINEYTACRSSVYLSACLIMDVLGNLHIPRRNREGFGDRSKRARLPSKDDGGVFKCCRLVFDTKAMTI